MFRLLGQRLREAASVTPTAHVNSGRPRSAQTLAKGDAVTAAVEREPWGLTLGIGRELGLSQPTVLEELRDNELYSRSAYLFSDHRPLRM
jgi:hypothetical protein